MKMLLGGLFVRPKIEHTVILEEKHLPKVLLCCYLDGMEEIKV